jgi:hypothetical protein
MIDPSAPGDGRHAIATQHRQADGGEPETLEKVDKITVNSGFENLLSDLITIRRAE